MTALQMIDEEIRTKEAEKLILLIATDALAGLTPDEIIDKYVWQVKGRRSDSRMIARHDQWTCSQTGCYRNSVTKYGFCEEHSDPNGGDGPDD